MTEKETALKVFYDNCVSVGDFLGRYYLKSQELGGFPVVLKHGNDFILFRASVGYTNLSIQYQKQDETWEELGQINSH
jgi:hypothetical protein